MLYSIIYNFLNWFSLYSSGYPGTNYVEQAVLKLYFPTAGAKGVCNHAWYILCQRYN